MQKHGVGNLAALFSGFGSPLCFKTGSGARTSKKDGLPGFLGRVGITALKITKLKFDPTGKLISLFGVGVFCALELFSPVPYSASSLFLFLLEFSLLP